MHLEYAFIKNVQNLYFDLRPPDCKSAVLRGFPQNITVEVSFFLPSSLARIRRVFSWGVAAMSHFYHNSCKYIFSSMCTSLTTQS